MVPILVAAAENVSDVVFEAPNDAVPVGTVAGLQFAAEFQLFVAGAAPQVASWACAETETRQLVASMAAARPRERRAKDRPRGEQARRIAPSATLKEQDIGRPAPAHQSPDRLPRES
jgi:hypothetical protein